MEGDLNTYKCKGNVKGNLCKVKFIIEERKRERGICNM